MRYYTPPHLRESLVKKEQEPSEKKRAKVLTLDGGRTWAKGNFSQEFRSMPLPLLIASALVPVWKLLKKLHRRLFGRKHRTQTHGPSTPPHPPKQPTKDPEIPDVDLDRTEPPPAKPALVFEISVTSAPSEADIRVDGIYVSITPYDVPLSPGKHKIAIKKEGRKQWQKTMKVVGAGQRIHAELRKSWF
jgi:hypothetical protein